MMMKKITNLLIIIALLFLPSYAHAKNTSPKPYRNFKLQVKNGELIYRISEKYKPSLTGGTAKINTNALTDKGYTGQGYTVAVIDTGVDFSHSFLAGKKAGEACFTTNNSCPNGGTEMYGDGAARPVHWHGTHVAGIVAGSNADMRGVAPGASILGINVFEKDNSSYEENIVSALNYVNTVRVKYNIISVNLSLGTTKLWTTTCDTASPEMTDIIHTLIDNNVAVVAAAGNSASFGMANPACISGVTSVASTYTVNDNVTDFSNIVSFTTFAAPGYLINSSVTGQAFKQASGTSMSTPFVAGAFALYASYKPSLSVLQRVTNLQYNCPKAYDAPTKISICRLDFTNVAGGSPDTPVVTTTTTTVPSPVVTNPPVVTVPPVSTTSTTLVYVPMLGKPRLNSLSLYSTGSLYLNYTDPTYGKSLIDYYQLTCNDGSVYTFSPLSSGTNHVTSFNSVNKNISSCSLNFKSTTGEFSSSTQYIPVYKV
jgi:subtilisin family serine protease